LIPLLDKLSEEQNWDIAIHNMKDWTDHTGATFLTFDFLEDSEYRWIEYGPVYEERFEEMVRTVDPEAQEEKIRQLEQYIYDRAYSPFIYSLCRSML
jgi:hypothetical protein